MQQYNEYYNKRFQLFDKIAALLCLDWVKKKNKVDPSDPFMPEKRKQVNESMAQDLRNLRKYYFGKKCECDCDHCRYYLYWEHDLIHRAGGDKE